MANKVINDAVSQSFIDSIVNKKLIPDEMLQAFVVAIGIAVRQKPGIVFDDNLLELCDLVNNYWRLEKYKQAEDPTFIYQMGRLLSCVTLLGLFRADGE